MPKTVRGVITQGARGLEGSTSAENRAFVRKYKLAHSLTGKDWSYITDSKTGFAKVKEGDAHTHSHIHKISLRLTDTYVLSFLRLSLSVLPHL